MKEAFFVFSQLRCSEQMWDSEGKAVDNQVVEKLLSRYTDFFKKNMLGKDIFLTYRVPNPSVEKEQGKILLETLHSIPRAFDVANAINGRVPPIFEVILPMCTTAQEIERVRQYYEKVIIGKKDTKVADVSVKQWVGDFKPEGINVIPLFENYDAFLNAHTTLAKYLRGKRLEYQRVFLARSDPALNYGSVSAVLLAKIALQRLDALERRSGTEILPILGVGSAPFRGNLRPDNVSNCSEEYPSIQTFTIQSSFKYDHPFRDVANAVDILEHGRRRPPLPIEEEEALRLIKKIKSTYQKQIVKMADMVNGIAAYVPARRARKLHVGLFGYARSMGSVTLPRAIKFCAAFYSMGLPPELLGLSALSDKDWDKLGGLYDKLDEDLRDSSRFLNRANLLLLPKEVRDSVGSVLDRFEFEEDPEYVQVTSRILQNFTKGRHALLSEDIKSAAWMRKFLG